MKLWQKTTSTMSKEIETFTVGKDRDFDLLLAPYDVLGSLAHIHMLHTIGLLTAEEWVSLRTELIKIYHSAADGQFVIDESMEDVHSQVEYLLTASLGETGKKIHAARSRNDQVLVDLKLYLRDEIRAIATTADDLFTLLVSLSEKHRKDLMPGYTHLQLAMPSSFGLWFGAYAESLVDDLNTLLAAFRITNKNPLGSAAGYGSSFPIDRTLTTRLLGFDDLNYNVVYAQMTRGKTEKILAQAIANIAATLGKMAMDVCLFMNENFGFLTFPEALTTGSSIMPHKKNPDVWELVRSRCNQLQALPNDIAMMLTNLPSGYHRDLQLIKELIFPATAHIRTCLVMAQHMFTHIIIKENLLTDTRYQYLFSVEEVNRLVLSGVPFRDAYKQVGDAIANGSYTYSTDLQHTHEGSIGSLCNEHIVAAKEAVLKQFDFGKIDEAVRHLIGE